MYEEIRGDDYALADDDVSIKWLDGRGVLVPRSLRKAGPEAQLACDAVMRKATELDDATRELETLVHEAREVGLSWDAIGWAVGTTGEAVRQRWGSES
jgi:ketosteroid isomerase-like protein